MKIAIDDTDEGLEELQQEKNQNNYPIVPGEKLQHLMTEWNEDEMNNISAEDQHIYATEFWLSLKQFEAQL